jgi:hypothetical protein
MIGLAALPVAATAQTLVPVRRNVVGLSAAVMQPTGEFDRFLPWGGGLGLDFVSGLGRHGILGLRLDAAVLWYGHEHYDVWLSPRVPDAYFRVSTDNLIATVGVGPQLTLGNGPVRPYGFGLLGGSYFATTSSVEDDWGETLERDLNYDDLTLGLSAGGGLLVQLGGRSHPFYMDLGAQWTRNGRATYLREGSIVDNPDGSITVFPIRSDANLWTFRLGVAVGI